MQLTVRDVAELIEVEEKTIERWVKERKLHAHRIGGQYLFDRLDLFELVVQYKLPELPATIIERILDLGGDDSLATALEAGGVVNDVEGTDVESVFRNIVERLPVPKEFGRDALLRLLLSRDFFQTTALSEGIAVPHSRRPLVLPVPAPVAMFCRLQQPLVFGSSSSKPVHAILVLMSPTVRSHLVLLAQFIRSLHDDSIQGLIGCSTLHSTSAPQAYAVAS